MMKLLRFGLFLITVGIVAGCVAPPAPMLQMPSTYEPPKQPSPVLALQELSDALVKQLVANVDSTTRLAIAVSLQSPPGTGNDNLRVVMT